MPEVIDKLKRRFDAATDTLDPCDREQRMSRGRRPTLPVHRVICTDKKAMHWPDTGPTLARHWPDTGPALARHWPDTGPTLARHWPEKDIGSLRVPLNALVRVFRT